MEELFKTEGGEAAETAETAETTETTETAETTKTAETTENNGRAALKEKRGRRKKEMQRVILAALFSALAFGVSVAVHFKVGGFLTLDFKDAILAIGGMFLGPVAAALMSAVAALLELTVSNTGFYGLLMNFIASAAFSVAAALVYKYRKSFTGAILSLAGAVASMTSVMMIANLVVTPLYTGMTSGQVAAMIPTLLLPFNLIKATLNASLVALLYKPLSAGLSRIFPDAHPRAGAKFGLRSLIFALVAVALFVAAMIVLFVVFRAEIAFKK